MMVMMMASAITGRFRPILWHAGIAGESTVSQSTDVFGDEKQPYERLILWPGEAESGPA
jgi:hypothetical protein